MKTKVYAGRLKDRASLLRSSSGGAFVALSDCFLDNGDAVVCAVYNYEDHATEFQLMEKLLRLTLETRRISDGKIMLKPFGLIMEKM